MTPAEAFAACEVSVRRADPDLYFASLFAPADKRPLLHALYAFNHELVRAGEAAREPLVTGIRLEWWREALYCALKGRPRSHPVAVALTVFLSQGSVGVSDLDDLIAAREVESSPKPIETLTALESHANATSGRLMRIAAQLLGAANEVGDVIFEAGIAYGLAGILRSLPFRATHGKLFLPIDLFAQESVTASEALLHSHSAALKCVVDRVAARASDHFGQARKIAIPKNALPAIVPAALVPRYLSLLAKSADPLRERTEISQLPRQLILLR